MLAFLAVVIVLVFVYTAWTTYRKTTTLSKKSRPQTTPHTRCAYSAPIYSRHWPKSAAACIPPPAARPPPVPAMAGESFRGTTDPAARPGMYPTQRPVALVDTLPQMETERNGVSITNGKANRVLWGFRSGIKAGVQQYPKFPTAVYNDDHNTELEDAFVYDNMAAPNYNTLVNSPNTPDEFINATAEITQRLSSFKPVTGLPGGERDYKKYVSDVINIDDIDARITNANLNKGFKITQANVLNSQSKVEKYRPFYEDQLRERTCWLNADDPIM